jgi:hypothetical protein
MKAYSFYCDRSDTRFQDLFTTLQSRESAFKKSKANHRIYLMNILKMSDKQLSTNKANIPGKEIKILAQKILVNHFETEGNDGNVYATRMDNMKNKKENELNKDNYPYKPFNSLRDSSFNINRFGWHDRNELGFLKA